MTIETSHETTDVDTLSIVPIVPEELTQLEGEIGAFRRGEREAAQFQSFRLRQGIYGQRQPDAHMYRVKIPGGILTAAQLEALGDIARDYAPLGKGHITTRENVQYHHVPLEDTARVMRRLNQAGLSSREACGNTVRNVVTCPLAGVCRDEVFDVVPYLTAFVRYFVRKPFTQNMPRKFKPSFSPCASDCAVAPFHDIGFVAQVREVDGELRQGFRIYVGGGSSIMPRAAKPLYDFVPVEEYLRVSEAILRVFNKADMLRKNRMMARIKVLIDRIGLDTFREQVEAELREPWAAEPIDPTPWMLKRYEPTPPPAAAANGVGHDDAAFQRWRQTNVVPQRQAGYVATHVTVPLGDLSAAQFHGLAALTRRYANGQARATVEQNLALRWVPEGALYDLWRELVGLDLGEAGAQEITDIVSCPGTDSCKLGITSSMGLNRALRHALDGEDLSDPLVRKLHIKISGCPNGCGRHHLGNIGFHGAAVKSPDGRQVPAYELFVGGEYEGGRFHFAERAGEKIPAHRVPEAVRRILAHYRDQRQPGEEFNAFVRRIGPAAIGQLVAELRPIAADAAADLFVDFDRSAAYRVERGEGECAV